MKSKLIETLRKNRDLITIFTKREIESRYKGSFLGIMWSIVNPLLMLSVYTLVFSKIFKSRWGNLGADGFDDPTQFAVNLFAGLIVFNIFAECANKGPYLISSNPNYVKKVVFPVEILGIATAGSALFHGIISLLILISIRILNGEGVSPSVMVLPILWGSYIIGITGMCWILSLIGALIKDIGQIVGSVVSIMMFLSPVFYPTEMIPQGIKWIADINPLAYIIGETRKILFDGEIPNIGKLTVFIVISFVTSEISLGILKRKQKGLGDVL